MKMYKSSDMVKYSPPIVTMAVSVAVCDIFTIYITIGHDIANIVSFFRVSI